MSRHIGWIGDTSVRPRAGDTEFLDTDRQLAAQARRNLGFDIALLHQEKAIQAVYVKACQIDASGKNAQPMWHKYERLCEAHKWCKRRYFTGTLEEAQEVMDREAACLESNRAPYPVFGGGER